MGATMDAWVREGKNLIVGCYSVRLGTFFFKVPQKDGLVMRAFEMLDILTRLTWRESSSINLV